MTCFDLSARRAAGARVATRARLRSWRQLSWRLSTCLLSAALLACKEDAPAAPNRSEPGWVSTHSPRAKVALVFVHGVFGDTFATWKPDHGDGFFDYVKRDSEIGPVVDMLAFGYTSKMLGDGSLDIQEAANLLHQNLQYHGVLDYPAMVFVAHSMGGLVVLRELLTRRELLERVPALVLYSTPQEGAQITTIARTVANNPALEQMLPADSNGYLRLLNDEWKSLPTRPAIACGYEKLPTHGVMVVGWESATRFCDHPAMPINADHLSIVKPTSAADGALMLLVNTLKTYVVGKEFSAKLELPDFQTADGVATLTIGDPMGKRDARLVNAGGAKLRYTLAEFPERGLYVFPGTGPAEIKPHEMHTLQFALGYGATQTDYSFVLKADGSADLKVQVKVPDLPTVQRERERTSALALGRIDRLLTNPVELRALRQARRGDAGPAVRVVEVVHDAVAERNPDLAEAGRWILTAELLNLVNWPDLGAHALRTAVDVEPGVAALPSVRSLAAVTAGLSGQEFAAIPIEPVLPPASERPAVENPFTTAKSQKAATAVAAAMQRVPALDQNALSLRGDLEIKRGNSSAAVRTYSRLAASDPSPSPSVLNRLERARRSATLGASEF